MIIDQVDSGIQSDAGSLEPNNPSFSFNVVLNSHDSAENFGRVDIKKMIDESDILVLERFGWGELSLASVRAVAKREITPEALHRQYDLPQDTYDFQVLKALYGTNKKVLFLDYPIQHRGWLEIDDQMNAWENKMSLKGWDGNVDSLVMDTRTMLEKRAKAENERESYIVSQAKKELDIVKDDPDFFGKKDLKVMLLYGSAHIGLLRKLKNDWENVVRTGQVGTPFNYFTEAKRRFMFGKEVSNELILRVMMEYQLYDLFESELDRLPASSDRGSFARKVVSSFSVSQIRDLFDQCVYPQQSYGGRTREGFTNAFEPFMQEVGQQRAMEGRSEI